MHFRFHRPPVLALPSRPAGSWLVAAALLAAVAVLVPLHAGFAADFTPDQRKAIETNDHEERLRAIEARAGIGSAHASH